MSEVIAIEAWLITGYLKLCVFFTFSVEQIAKQPC